MLDGKNAAPFLAQFGRHHTRKAPEDGHYDEVSQTSVNLGREGAPTHCPTHSDLGGGQTGIDDERVCD